METAIFGAGKNGENILAGLLESGQAVDYFIDDNMAGQRLSNVPIITSTDSANRPARVYVSVVPQRDGVSDRTRHDDVCRELDLQQHDVIDFVSTLRTAKHILDKYFDRSMLWMSKDTNKMVNSRQIELLHNLLSDEKSRDLLDQIVALRKTRDMANYVLPDGAVEYFPDDLPLLDSLTSVRFADCGAYTGDTVSDLLVHAHRPIDQITCFEPDSANLAKLTETIENLSAHALFNSAHICPCGVWSSNTMAEFAAGNGSSSALSRAAENTITVPLVTLDTVLSGARPNYIKMDIEGAEKEALLGARRIIESDAPVLAVCVYHKPADLWELPLLIHAMRPDYKMGLRVHGHLGLSTILYCYH